MRASGNALRTSAVRPRSTSATATRRTPRPAVRARMSARAMPAAPKLTWLSVALGWAPAWWRKTNGAARAAAALRAVRRRMGQVLSSNRRQASPEAQDTRRRTAWQRLSAGEHRDRLDLDQPVGPHQGRDADQRAGRRPVRGNVARPHL